MKQFSSLPSPSSTQPLADEMEIVSYCAYAQDFAQELLIPAGVCWKL